MTESPLAPRPSRSTVRVVAGMTLVAILLMAWDHLWGNQGGSEDSFPVDPGAFLLTLGLIAVTAIIVSSLAVRSVVRHPESTHRAALGHSLAAVLLALPAAWLGFPVVVAGGGIALGLQAMHGTHRRLAVTAIALGVLVLCFAVLATAFPPSDSD